jgi:protein-tyrosine kinase
MVFAGDAIAYRKTNMSRTFDVLDRIQQDRDLFRLSPITKAKPSTVGRVDRRTFLPDSESFTRDEVLRLIQRLFLTRDHTGDHARRQVVFCGIDNSEGSHLLCARIARILAKQVRSQVCVVDANVYGPSSNSLAELLPLDDLPTEDGGPTAGISRRVSDNLWLASCDPACGGGPTPTLADVQTWISELPPECAHVVISAPPIGLYADAASLGKAADGVVLILEANATRWRTALKAKQALEDADVKVLGTVLNNRTFPIPEKLYRLL